jgi:hypothetical protein
MSFLTTSGCIAAVSLAFLCADAERPRFAPSENLELHRAYEGTIELQSEPMRMTVNGEPVPAEQHPNLSITILEKRAFEFSDTIEKAEDGRATKLARQFEKIGSTGTETLKTELPDGEEKSSESKKNRVSGLEGKQVRFSWDAEKDEYARKFVDEGDEDLLDELEADADYTGFLPKKDVEEGDEWEIDPKLIGRLDAPSGDLHLHEEGEEEDESSRAMNEQLDDNTTGEAKGTWRGTREVDGRRMGVIELTSAIKTQGEVEGEDGKRAISLEIEYAGEVLWDLAGGHLARIEVSGPVKARFVMSRELEGPQGKLELSQEFQLSGESKHVLAVRR